MDLGLTGRRAVVTGGSQGIGLSIASELSAEGVDVAICARNADGLTAAAAEITSRGGGVYAASADVTVPQQVEDFIASSADELGGIDILVNNAGAATPGNFQSLTDEAWQRDIDVKIMAQVRCIRAALPFLQMSPSARIININAVYARYPDPAFFATSVNRAACLNLSKTLAIELAPEGVLVNSVNIGYVLTPQWENIRSKRAPESSLQNFTRDLAQDEVPLGRFGETTEVSGVVAFLASDRSSYVTGASIDVAGGMGKYA